MASQFPVGAAPGTIFKTGAGDTYQYLNDRWQLTVEQDLDPTFDIYSRINSLRWGSNGIVYENVFDAITDGTISAYGGNWADSSTHSGTNYWNNANILKLNDTTTDPLTASTAIKVQPGYSMVWVRVLNDLAREIHLDLYFDEGNASGGPVVGTYSDEEIHYSNAWFPERWAPYNSIISPHRDNYQHIWLPLILPNANGGTAYLVARKHTFATPDYWISGLAITANPWGFSRIQAITAHRGVRIGSIGGVNANKPDWHGAALDSLCVKRAGSGTAVDVKMRLSVVDNGVDKVVHVVGLGDTDGVYRPQIPLLFNGVLLQACESALDPFSWHIINNNRRFRVTSYLVPAATVALNTGFADLTFQANALKNNIWYFSEILCNDLRA